MQTILVKPTASLLFVLALTKVPHSATLIAAPIVAPIAAPVQNENASWQNSLPATSLTDTTWQFSVPAPSIDGRRAYLWIPPDCKRVRGLIVAAQNMLEKPLFERVAFRRAAAENGLGLLLIFPGHDKAPDDDKNPGHPKRSSLDIFLNPTFPSGDEDPKRAGEDLQKVLDALAIESGYSELRYAPLLPVGHSSAGSFVWHLYRWDASRIFAMLPFKTGLKEDGPQGIPIFNIESEWFDYGKSASNVWSKPGDIQKQQRVRSNGENSQFGFYVDIGAGHCNVSDDSMQILSLFLKEVVAARLPKKAPLDKPVALKPLTPESGWLIDIAKFGQSDGKAVAYRDFKGDPRQGFWYVDQELATAVQRHMQDQLAKKPQHLGYLRDGVVSTSGGMFTTSPNFLDDGATFQLEGSFLDTLTDTDLQPPRTALGHSDTPIYYRINSGGLVQTGPNSFRVRPHFGPLSPQGNPWEPTIIAYSVGDKTYRPTEHPAHINISIFNTAGASQTLDFPKIENQNANQKKPIALNATASSALPVEYFMVSGPAKIGADGKTLLLTHLPPRSKFPVRVIVGAYQWGRSIEPKVQSVGPVTQEFFVTR